MKSKLKTLSGAILLVLTLNACDNDNNGGSTDTEGPEIPDVSVAPADTLDQVLSANTTDEPLLLNLAAIQSEFDALDANTGISEPVLVLSGDSARSLLARAQGQ